MTSEGRIGDSSWLVVSGSCLVNRLGWFFIDGGGNKVIMVELDGGGTSKS